MGVIGLLVVVVPAVAILVWRDRQRGPVCPACGKRGTFTANENVCENCGLDIRTGDY